MTPPPTTAPPTFSPGDRICYTLPIDVSIGRARPLSLPGVVTKIAQSGRVVIRLDGHPRTRTVAVYSISHAPRGDEDL